MELDTVLPESPLSHFLAFTNYILLYQFLCISSMTNSKSYNQITNKLLLGSLLTELEAHDYWICSGGEDQKVPGRYGHLKRAGGSLKNMAPSLLPHQSSLPISLTFYNKQKKGMLVNCEPCTFQNQVLLHPPPQLQWLSASGFFFISSQCDTFPLFLWLYIFPYVHVLYLL